MWVLHGLCEETVFQGLHAQEWVPGSVTASSPLAPLGVPAGGLGGQVQAHILWDSAKSTQERIIAESRAHAQAGGQTIVAMPVSSIKALGIKNKESTARQLVRRLGTFEGWQWKKGAAEGAAETGTGAGDPAKSKGKKEKVPGELWYIGSEQEWSQLDWKEWSRRVGGSQGAYSGRQTCMGESGSQ